MKAVRLSCAIPLSFLLAAVAAPSAWAWGCKGHQIVALIAEKHLNAHARAVVMQILAASPISPDLRRYCGDSGLDAFADSSTWADDERSIRPDTAGWHFIDIPRGAPKGDIAQYCPHTEGCVTSAIAAAWAWQGHEVAENVVYGDLPNKIPVERPREVTTCADDDHISNRMLKLNERISDAYEAPAESTVQEQLG